MRKGNSPITLLVCLLFICAVPTKAQSQSGASAQPPPFANATDGMAFAKTIQSDMELIMELEMESLNSPIGDSPFSAQVSVETDQVLGDGTHITRKTNGSLSRDSAGRLRQELTISLPSVPSTADIGKIVIIFDPTTGAQWTLMPAMKTAMKMTMPLPTTPKQNTVSKTEFFGDEGTAEKLGTENIEGVTVTGTRYTSTVPAGQLGNNQPLQLVSERWYSADLHVPLLLKRTDPMNGSKTLKLTDIRRDEPDPALFSVPADYVVKEFPIFAPMTPPTNTEGQKPTQP